MQPNPTVLQWTLLGFASWTLAVLAFTVGLHRWNRILREGAGLHEFPADASNGPDWYQRGTRAHANCVENLPVYGAIVVVASVAHVGGGLVDVLAVTTLAARVAQSLVHVAFVQTHRVVSVRFSFFLVQLVAMTAMIVLILRR